MHYFQGSREHRPPLEASAQHMSYQNPVFPQGRNILKTSLSAHVMFLVTRDDANSV